MSSSKQPPNTGAQVPPQTLEVLDQKDRTVPNQIGPHVEQVDGRAVFRADITKVAPDRHQPVVKTTETNGDVAMGAGTK